MQTVINSNELYIKFYKNVSSGESFTILILCNFLVKRFKVGNSRTCTEPEVVYIMKRLLKSLTQLPLDGEFTLVQHCSYSA